MIDFHPSWPEPARTLLRRAIDRHGGWSLWERLESVTVCLTSLAGLLPRVKGYGRTFRLPGVLTAFPKRVRSEWREEAGGRCVGVFDRGDVSLVDPAAGAVGAESREHRRTFRGLRKLRRWSRLDAFYFFGYAFASYTAVPFVLPGLPYLATVRGRWRGEPLEGVRVRWPADAQVHSRVQQYLFDSGGLLRRNDYVADVVGAFARGAHGWDDHVTVEGLPIPARRTVVPRLGSVAVPFPTVLLATLHGFSVRLGAAEGAPAERKRGLV